MLASLLVFTSCGVVNYAFMLADGPFEFTFISTTAALLTRNDKLALQNCQKALRARPYNPPVQVCQRTLADHVWYQVC